MKNNSLILLYLVNLKPYFIRNKNIIDPITENSFVIYHRYYNIDKNKLITLFTKSNYDIEIFTTTEEGRWIYMSYIIDNWNIDEK